MSEINTIYELKEKLKTPELQYRPEVRWWLAEGFHTDETLKRDIGLLYESGFGAVEFLAMSDDGVDSSNYGWGSEEWVHDSHLIIEETTKRGMGVSTTSGTNWANANLITITPDDRAAAKELDFVAVTLSPGEVWGGEIPYCKIDNPVIHKQELVAVVAAKRLGKKGESVLLDPDNIQILDGQVKDGRLSFQAPLDGKYELLFFRMHGTGQTAEPSVSVSYTVNYIDRYGSDAVIDYWDREILTEDLKKNIRNNDRVMMYMDSLELDTCGEGNLFWGYHMQEEFQRRRGYDITPYLPFLVKFRRGIGIDMMPPIYRYEMEDETRVWKVRNDLYQTFTDLYMENMLCPLQKWLHYNGMQLRAEISYGMPFEISQPGKYVDGVETESLEFASQIDSYRGLAGTAHMYGRQFSSETGANLYNYMLGLDFYTQILFTQFAAGVSKTVLHGYSSIAGSENATYWPGHEGMLPVFAERFGSRQPSSVHYQDWTSMIGRYQMVLRQGRPRVDLAILRLDYYFNNMFLQYGPEKETYEEKFMRANEGIYWKDMRLQNMGFTYEYLAPQLLEEDMAVYDGKQLCPEGAGYQAVIVYQEGLPVSTGEKLLDMAKKGLPVLFVDGVTETIHVNRDKTHKKAASITPFQDGQDEKLEEIIKEMESYPNVRRVHEGEDLVAVLEELKITPRCAYSVSNKNLLTHYRETEKTDYIYVYHYMYTEKDPYKTILQVKQNGKPYRIDAWSGDVSEISCYRYDGEHLNMELELMPGEAALLAIDKTVQNELHVERILAGEGEILKKNGVLCLAGKSAGNYVVEFNDQSSAKVWSDGTKCRLLEDWSLEVEDWNEGERILITEDRGKGLLTREVYYETKKERIVVGKTPLLPWKDLPMVGPAVSGVGRYATEVVLPDTWDDLHRAVLKLGSVCGNTAAVYVNGKKAPGLDFDRLSLDISSMLHGGRNHICVEVSTTLQNRLLDRGYYRDHVYPMSGISKDGEWSEETGLPKAHVDDYGLTGGAELEICVLSKIKVPETV